MKCNEESCSAEATHMPKICVPAKGYAIDTHQPISVVFGLQFCLEHARTFDAKGTLALDVPGNLRTVIQIMARGRAEPDFDRVFVQPVSIDSEESERMIAAMSTRDFDRSSS